MYAVREILRRNRPTARFSIVGRVVFAAPLSFESAQVPPRILPSHARLEPTKSQFPASIRTELLRAYLPGDRGL
jgi:hypothetical protein